MECKAFQMAGKNLLRGVALICRRCANPAIIHVLVRIVTTASLSRSPRAGKRIVAC